ncbi:MAG: TetR/AcrR family transcriptional regulator [Propionibacteriales bacterium]|nr:TetR/AcrR family transcriptional regulator [Propionibacteriales bacterium]
MSCSRPRIEGARENEILDATVNLLASAGYDRLTMDAVATEAKASKATLYRRWATKAELVVDAIARAKGAPHANVVDTGSLRGDLLAMACDKGGLNDPHALKVVSSVITALQHDQEFSDAFHERFLQPTVARTRAIYERAKQRGEISEDVDLDILTHVLAAVILHRAFVLRLSVDDDTVKQIIDEVVIPAATRRSAPTGPRQPNTPTTIRNGS